MNYATAKAIAAQVAPTLLVDDMNAALPDMFVVRKVAKGFGKSFSIHLPTIDPTVFHLADIPARDAVPEQPAIPATADHPGTPAIPAQPAVVARTVAGQIAEQEQKLLTDALAQAVKVLG